jgi:hypothetical protein
MPSKLIIILYICQVLIRSNKIDVLNKSVLRFFFSGTVARGTLQDVKRERPKSRFAAVSTLNLKTHPQPPKDTARILKIQRTAC